MGGRRQEASAEKQEANGGRQEARKECGSAGVYTSLGYPNNVISDPSRPNRKVTAFEN